ncbi:MAG: HAMP domain-containing histidine kinase [Myxococcales bacterium]|nr:HAMP domain-containing histidine kinase [Myxococcales bacterium]
MSVEVEHVALPGPGWLVKLRWVAVAGEATALLAAVLVGLELPIVPLVLLVGGHAASNEILRRVARRGDVREHVLGSFLVLDAWLLTALLGLTGGPSNPFSVLYFTQVLVASLLLGPGWTFALWLNTVSGYALIFFDHRPVPGLGAHAHGGMSMHLWGMWLAYVLTSGLLAAFVLRLASAARDRDARLATLRDRAARAERVASLTSLAAGAAHELGTPLATIAVVAGELARSLDGAAADDARLIRAEVDRCRAVLDSLSARAGDVTGAAPEPVRFSALASSLREKLSCERAARLVVRGEGVLLVPAAPVQQALESLVANAFDASAPESEVELRLEAGDAPRVLVVDRGEGMDAAQLARVGEPFVTTKAGRGLGLGVFLAKVTAEGLGGDLHVESAVGEGTTVTLTLPLAAMGTEGMMESTR